VFEHHGGPSGARDHGIEQRHQPAPSVKHGQLHRKGIHLSYFDTGECVFFQAMPVACVERASFDKQPAGDAAQAGFFH
jgi:hypothetical protein